MEQNPLQVVVFVLEDPSGPPRQHGLKLGAVEALGLDLHALRALEMTRRKEEEVEFFVLGK